MRDDERAADLLAQMSFSTYQAYNNWGGKSLYPFLSVSNKAAAKVSFNRPYLIVPSMVSRGSGEFLAARGLAGWEYNMVRWLEREGYDVSYCSSVDTHATPGLLWSHKGFIVMGHDEYWSYPMRWNVEAARDRGINLAFLASNVAYWQVRFEPSTVDGAPNRNMVCYKNLNDPIAATSSNYLTTVNFRSSPVNNWETSLLGVSYDTANVFGDLVVSDPGHWVFANTGVAAGQRLAGLLGYEVDSTNAFSPPGTAVACSSPYFVNPGSFSSRLLYCNAASYTAPSGAKVFASGSMQWCWGLDDDDYNVPYRREFLQNPIVQHATRNVLAALLTFRDSFLPHRSLHRRQLETALRLRRLCAPKRCHQFAGLCRV